METCAYCDAKPLFRDHESGAYLCPAHAWLEVTGPRAAGPRPPLTVRPAAPDDRPQIAALAEYFWDSPEIVRFDRPHRLDTLPAYVACDADRIVGLAVYTREDDALSIVALDVLPQWQGRGAATGLLTEAIHEARSQGVGRIAIAVTNDNLPALGLYQRFGFVITRVLAGRLAGSPDDAKAGFDSIPIRDEIQLELRLDE
jgi:ribosomal protein S18 acetylase RimI-like enzyme